MDGDEVTVGRPPQGDRLGVEPPRRQVVLVHGAWHGAWCWSRHWTDHLVSAGYPPLVISLPQHDRAGSDSRIWTRLETCVDAVEVVVQQSGPDTVLIGHSMGGLVAQLCLMRGNRVGGLVLLASPPPSGILRPLGRRLRRHPGPMLKSAVSMSLWPMVSSKDTVKDMFFTADTSPETVEWTRDRLQNESMIALSSMCLRRLKVRDIEAPVLVLAAQNDQIFNLKDQDRLARRYGTSPTVVEGSGHDLMLDSQWRSSVETVIDWIGRL